MISGADSLMPLIHLAHPPSHNTSSNPLCSAYLRLLCFVPLPVFILFLLPYPYAHLFCILKSSYEWSHMIFAFLWLISLSIIPSSSIHVVANSTTVFYLLTVLPSFSPLELLWKFCQAMTSFGLYLEEFPDYTLCPPLLVFCHICNY